MTYVWKCKNIQQRSMTYVWNCYREHPAASHDVCVEVQENMQQRGMTYLWKCKRTSSSVAWRMCGSARTSSSVTWRMCWCARTLPMEQKSNRTFLSHPIPHPPHQDAKISTRATKNASVAGCWCWFPQSGSFHRRLCMSELLLGRQARSKRRRPTCPEDHGNS